MARKPGYIQTPAKGTKSTTTSRPKGSTISRKGDVTVRPAGTPAGAYKGPTVRNRGTAASNRKAAVAKANKINRRGK